MNKKIKNILLKKNKTKIVSLTAYSKNIEKILDNYCDIILVGDSMANVLYGLKNTHEITLNNIIQHTVSVKKGVKKSEEHKQKIRDSVKKYWEENKGKDIRKSWGHKHTEETKKLLSKKSSIAMKEVWKRRKQNEN